MDLTPPQKFELSELAEADIEQYANNTSYLSNNVVKNLAWSDVSVEVIDRETKEPKQILGDVNGYVTAGMNPNQLSHGCDIRRAVTGPNLPTF